MSDDVKIVVVMNETHGVVQEHRRRMRVQIVEHFLNQCGDSEQGKYFNLPLMQCKQEESAVKEKERKQ